MRNIPVISAREGTAPAEGDFWTECWLVKSAASMWMGQQWHFQAIRYVNSQREKAAGARKGEMTRRWMKYVMMNIKCFCIRKEVVLSFCRPSSFFHAFLSFLFFPWMQRNRLSAISGDGARRKIASMQRSQTKGAPCVYLLYCAIKCRLCNLKVHCLAFGSSFFLL